MAAFGIGTTAIQIAKALGHKVFVTAGSADKCRACEELGADRAINYKTEDFVAEVKALTGGRGADVILDMVAGPYLARELSCVADDGRSVVAFSGVAIVGDGEELIPACGKRRRAPAAAPADQRLDVVVVA